MHPSYGYPAYPRPARYDEDDDTASIASSMLSNTTWSSVGGDLAMGFRARLGLTSPSFGPSNTAGWGPGGATTNPFMPGGMPAAGGVGVYPRPGGAYPPQTGVGSVYGNAAFTRSLPDLRHIHRQRQRSGPSGGEKFLGRPARVARGASMAGHKHLGGAGMQPYLAGGRPLSPVGSVSTTGTPAMWDGSDINNHSMPASPTLGPSVIPVAGAAAPGFGYPPPAGATPAQIQAAAAARRQQQQQRLQQYQQYQLQLFQRQQQQELAAAAAASYADQVAQQQQHENGMWMDAGVVSSLAGGLPPPPAVPPMSIPHDESMGGPPPPPVARRHSVSSMYRPLDLFGDLGSGTDGSVGVGGVRISPGEDVVGD
ncbi:hypothetical protein HK101_006850, partial [Irineochytrium annulatum]